MMVRFVVVVILGGFGSAGAVVVFLWCWCC